MSCVCSVKFKFMASVKFKAQYSKLFKDLDFEQQRRSRTQ
jgi:hypothetical protein